MEPARHAQQVEVEPTLEAVQAALAVMTVDERACSVAGRPVHVRCDAGLVDWLRPMTGAPVFHPRAELALTLCSAPVASDGAHVSVLPSQGGRVLRFEQPGVLAVLDRDARTLTGLVSPGRLPRWERAKPLSLPLTVWASDLGLAAVHAGFVARAGAGLLFAGPSGSGKSTCALACAAAGFEFLADDYVLVDPAQDFLGYGVYASAALDAQGLARVTGSPGPADDGGKVVVTAGSAGMPRVAREALPAALLLPRLSGAARTHLRPASRGEALARLAPSSILRRAVPAARNLALLARLTAALPAFWLEMSRQTCEIPEVLGEILEGRA